jgi:hypothetical protein
VQNTRDRAHPEDHAQPSATPERVPVYYVAHPVGAVADGPTVEQNLARARRWFLWLVANEPDVAFSMPWMQYVEVLPEHVHGNRARGLRDDIAMVSACDGIVLCGGRISSGMALELAAARAALLDVVDLTPLGDAPPTLPMPTALGATPRRSPRPFELLAEAEELRARIVQLETEVRRGEIVARAAGARIRELETLRIEAGLAELQDAKPARVAHPPTCSCVPCIKDLRARLIEMGCVDVGGEG